MKVTIHPSQLKGIIQAPASKSSMQRACAAALLSKGTSTFIIPDIATMIKRQWNYSKLGSKVEIEGSS